MNREQLFNLSANLSFMFTELPFVERYAAAVKAGFKYCESGFPPIDQGVNLNDVVEAKNKSGIEQVLLNLYTGDVTKGELGVTGIAGQEDVFWEHLNTTINLAQRLNVKMVHIMSGKCNDASPNQLDVYKKNLFYASEKLHQIGMVAVIEPISNAAVPNYFMNDYNLALSVINELRNENIKLMLDLFHCQQICGSITETVNKYWDIIGHIQLAQVPDRHEPFPGSGEIDYTYVFDLLKKKGYQGCIGLEYKPKDGTEIGLKWVDKFGIKLNSN